MTKKYLFFMTKYYLFIITKNYLFFKIEISTFHQITIGDLPDLSSILYALLAAFCTGFSRTCTPKI